MIVNIFHPSEDVTNTAAYYLGDRNGIKVCTKDIANIQPSLMRVKTVGVVLAGNSFGLMDGGIDLVAAKRWKNTQKDVQSAIAEQYFGELPVGCAVTVKSDGMLLIYAPTMQVPISIVGSAHVFYATFAALREAKRYGVNELWIPMLGCGAGGMSIQDSTMQIANAVSCANERVKGKNITWDFANRRHSIWHEMCHIPPDHFDNQETEKTEQ